MIPLVKSDHVITYSITVEPRFYDMGRGQQNHIVKSEYRCKRTPDLTIWRQSTKNGNFQGQSMKQEVSAT